MSSLFDLAYISIGHETMGADAGFRLTAFKKGFRTASLPSFKSPQMQVF